MRSLSLLCGLVLASAVGCSSSSGDDGSAASSNGAASGSGGSSQAGATSHGGSSGTTANGGSSASGGVGVGGTSSKGGSTNAGGASNGGAGVGGTSSVGGSQSNAGASGATSQGGSGGDSSMSGSGGDSSQGGAMSGGSGGSLPSGGTSGASGTSGDGGTSGAGGDSAGSGAGGSATESCGCHGQPGCAVWQNVYITFYGFNDNSCTVESQHDCDDIAYPGYGPKMHTAAMEGAGTYDDPITAAAGDQSAAGSMWETSGGATLSPGTIVYNPLVKKYFIMEDSCLECGDEWACHLSPDDTDDPNPPKNCQPGTNLHIDFWMGPSFQQDASTLTTCEDNSTFDNPYQGTGVVIVNPPPDLEVMPAPLYSGMGANGGCWTDSQVSGDSCP